MYSTHREIQINADTDPELVETYNRATYDIEQLRLEHNIEGAKYRNGEITASEWSRYQARFQERNMALGSSHSITATEIGYNNTPEG